jgi:hypothetical protein
MNPCALEGYSVPAPLVAPVVRLILFVHVNIIYMEIVLDTNVRT